MIYIQNIIRFCGAVHEVTGSMHLLTINGKKLLLDAGAFQGADSKSKNLSPLPFNPSDIDFIFLSHAHYDHMGRLPVLCQRGFKGKIIATPTTKEIAFRLMDDSLRIQKDEGEELLFGEEDVAKAKSLFEPVNKDYPEWEDDEKKIKVLFIPSEHILGSASIFIKEPVSLLYTGDLGGGKSSIHSIPHPPEACDYLVIESTYGNRELEKSSQEILLQLKDALEKVRKNRSRLLIPVFSIDRAEEILFMLRELNTQEWVYLDTPMGIDILDIYTHNKYLLSKILDMKGSNMGKVFYPANFERIRARKNSDELANSSLPCVILASSGMLEGGRIRGYLPKFLPEEKNILLFSGYQAEGTLGREIFEGNGEVDVDGTLVKVNAEIRKIEGLSAHADRTALLDYLDGFKILPSKVFIVHGEREASEALSQDIRNRFRIKTIVPKANEDYSLSAGEVRERTVTRELFTNNVKLNFENIAGMRIALFAGGIVDNADGYSLVSVREIEGLLHDLARVEPVIPEIEVPVIEVNGAAPEPKELVNTLVSCFKSSLISKSLVRDLLDASERGIGEYLKRIEKKREKDVLLLEEGDLKRRNITLENRTEVSKQLEDMLVRSSKMDPKTLQSSLERVFDVIK